MKQETLSLSLRAEIFAEQTFAASRSKSCEFRGFIVTIELLIVNFAQFIFIFVMGIFERLEDGGISRFTFLCA